MVHSQWIFVILFEQINNILIKDDITYNITKTIQSYKLFQNMSKSAKCRGGKFSGHRLALDTSRSYLLQQEMSPSGSVQFQLSPDSSSMCSLTPSSATSTGVNDYSYLGNNSWQSAGSAVPLLPNKVNGHRNGALPRKHYIGPNGVVDMGPIHIEGLNTGSPTKNYDYADYGHQYEELPGGRKSMVKGSMDSGRESEYQSQTSGNTDFTSEAGDMSVIVNTPAEKRKRVNPLYDAMTQSMPSIYNKPAKDEGVRRQLSCLKWAFVAMVIISCAALVVSIISVVRLNKPHETDPTLTPQVQKLLDEYDRLDRLLTSFQGNNSTTQALSDLYYQLALLRGNTSEEIRLLRQQLNDSADMIANTSEDVVSTEKNLTVIISQLNTTLQLQLYNLSRQPGPRGPQGVANFSLCEYVNVSNNAVASDIFSSYSPWYPTLTDLQTNIVIFAGCSVDGGTFHMLRTNAISPSKVQYSCECSGVIAGKDRRICYIHVLKCPRES